MYRDLGFLRVWGGLARRCPARRSGATPPAGAPYAYLVYPHKPIVAYLPQTRELLNEYCVAVPRRDAALRQRAAAGLRRRAGQVDGAHRRRAAAHRDARTCTCPAARSTRKQVRRDLWRLAQWERERLRRAAADGQRSPRRSRSRRAARGRPAAMSTNVASTSSTAAAPSPKGPSARAARAYLKGIGYDDEALAKPIIGVASTWIETMPCNFHLRALAAKVKEGIRDAGGTPMELNTIAISDGITMGTSGHEDARWSPARSSPTRSSSSRRGHLFDARRRAQRLRQDDPRHGHGARAARRPRASCSTAARSRPGASTAAT